MNCQHSSLIQEKIDIFSQRQPANIYKNTMIIFIFLFAFFKRKYTNVFTLFQSTGILILKYILRNAAYHYTSIRVCTAEYMLLVPYTCTRTS